MKKVLIVTYYWPPAGGPGVQRWLKFAKYLPEFGFEPIVYTPENPEYPIVDERLLAEVPENITVIRRPIWEPYALARIFSGKKTKRLSSGIISEKKKQGFTERVALWIRGNLFIPDARKFWVRPSVTFLESYLSEKNIDTVITTGPPHSLHLIGLELKRRTGVHWVADFRDPWTTIGYHKELKLSDAAAAKHKRLESDVLRSADRIIATSPTTCEELSGISGKDVRLITNGYDTHQVEKKPMDAKFSLAHIGSLLSERNPEILWQVLSELNAEIPGFADDLEVKLAGVVSPKVLDSLRTYGLYGNVRELGYLSHDAALSEQRRSQVLLLLEINSKDTVAIIPGKLFEYLVSGRPIVALGPEGSDFAGIIAQTNTGVFHDYSQKEKLKATISQFYDAYKAGTLRSHGIGLERYSRLNLTSQLADLLRSWES